VPGWIGFPELIVLLIVLLLIFGPKRLPEMGRSLGKGMREFKDSLTGKDESLSLPAGVERPGAVDHTDAQDTVAAPAPRENEPVSH
jgi:sec-independent protein translocase protein TatA